jgi:molybdopterin/thiamine biosynthesis adenylyltransferase
LIGAGGIGALAAITLAKMGVRYMAIHDMDTVDDVNISTQFHRVSDVGSLKVDALSSAISEYADDMIVARAPVEVNYATDLRGALIISAVDSIKARQQIWEAVKRSSAFWYLDARMAAEEYQHYLVDLTNPDDMAAYEYIMNTVNDEDVPDLVCTAKATIFCSCMSAGHIGHIVKQIVNGTAQSHRLVHNIPNNFLETFSLKRPGA